MKTRTLVFVFLACAISRGVGAGELPSTATTQALFQKGLAAYQSKQYTEAQDTFQKLLAQGIVNASVLHNLALTDYQLDQKPLALALWRKALSLQPSFRPARDGRALLEGKMSMRPLESDSLSLWTHRNLEPISLDELLWFNALLLALVGWQWLRYWGRRTHALEEESALPPFPTTPLILALLFTATLAVMALKIKDGFYDRATITATKVSVRSLPADDGVPLFDINGGNEVLVRRKQNGWTQVQNGDGASGWVKDSEILITSER